MEELEVEGHKAPNNSGKEAPLISLEHQKVIRDKDTHFKLKI